MLGYGSITLRISNLDVGAENGVGHEYCGALVGPIRLLVSDPFSGRPASFMTMIDSRSRFLALVFDERDKTFDFRPAMAPIGLDGHHG